MAYEFIAREYRWSLAEIKRLTVQERRWFFQLVVRRIDNYHASKEG